MNKFSDFYNDLKQYLINNKLQQKEDFENLTDIEIIKTVNTISKEIPLCYKEWLKVFGSTSCLLNFPIEDYTLEELIECQTEDEESFSFKSSSQELLLVSNYQDLYTYVETGKENPNTYQINIGNQLIKEELRDEMKFTTHIKSVIIQLIGKLIESENKSLKWFNIGIINEEARPFRKKKEFIELLVEVEKKELSENRIISIEELISIWNDKIRPTPPSTP